MIATHHPGLRSHSGLLGISLSSRSPISPPAPPGT